MPEKSATKIIVHKKTLQMQNSNGELNFPNKKS